MDKYEAAAIVSRINAEIEGIFGMVTIANSGAVAIKLWVQGHVEIETKIDSTITSAWQNAQIMAHDWKMAQSAIVGVQ